MYLMYLIPINNISHSTINGPGYRLVIWVQGCDFHCKGCFNPDTHPSDDRKGMPITRLAEIINKDKSIDGITLSGGEPLRYPIEINKLLKIIRKRLTRVIFTGFTVEEILKDSQKVQIMNQADLIIAGRYNANLGHPFLGKKFIRCTDRICLDYFKPTLRVEYTINKNEVTKTGIFKTIEK